MKDLSSNIRIMRVVGFRLAWWSLVTAKIVKRKAVRFYYCISDMKAGQTEEKLD